MRKRRNYHFGVCFVWKEKTFWIQNFKLQLICLHLTRTRGQKAKDKRTQNRYMKKKKRSWSWWGKSLWDPTPHSCAYLFRFFLFFSSHQTKYARIKCFFFFFFGWVSVYAGARTHELKVTRMTRYHLGQQARWLLNAFIFNIM